MSALAYSTDRAGCVSHPTPTRRCTHVGPDKIHYLKDGEIFGKDNSVN